MKLLILLLISFNAISQTDYDKIQDKIIAKLNEAKQQQDVTNIRYGLRIVGLEKDSAYQAKKILDNYNYFVGQIIAQNNKITSLENRINGFGLRIVTLEKQVKDLQAQIAIVNTLQALAPLKITRLGTTLAYRIEMYSATKNRDGYMTKELVNQIENNSKSTAEILKYNLSHSGNIVGDKMSLRK